MIVRLAAAVLDAVDALRMAMGTVRQAWLSVPGELLAWLVVAGSGTDPTSARRVPVEVRGLPGLEAVVIENPRLARYLDHVPVRPTAQTIGRHVLARGPLPDAILRHELEHVRQWARFGPLFLLAYLAASAAAWIRGENSYRGNRFEAAARAREAEPLPAVELRSA